MDMMDRSPFSDKRLIAFACIAVGFITALALYGRIPQSQAYYEFSDNRSFFGIPNFLDVVPICRSFWPASMACSSSETTHHLAPFLPCAALTSLFLSALLLSRSAQVIFTSTRMIRLSFGTGCR